MLINHFSITFSNMVVLAIGQQLAPGLILLFVSFLVQTIFVFFLEGML